MKKILNTLLLSMVLLLSGCAELDEGLDYAKEKYEQLDVEKEITELKSSYTDIVDGLDCPQINVSLNKISSEYYINEDKFNNWTLDGSPKCRAGLKDGENLNYYYCGGFKFNGFTDNILLSVKSTEVDELGNIGKPTKHIIWNIYNEEKEFIETRCLGNPDKFKKEQAINFEKKFNNKKN